MRSRKTWILIHIVYPLIPFVFAGLMRAVVNGLSITWDTFSASTLVLSVALISIFINQCLLTHKPPLIDEEQKDEMIGMATQFQIYSFIGFASFGVLVILNALYEVMEEPFIYESLVSIKFLAFTLWIYPIYYAFIAQKRFKLSARI